MNNPSINERKLMDNYALNTLESQENSTINKPFLQAIFGEDWETAHITSFRDDPSNIEPDRRGICWAGHYARPLPPGNQYFTISRFTPLDNKAVRRKAHFIACYVIVADDVVEKLPVALVEKLPAPNYKLLTSEGSQQWGWILRRPCHDRRVVDNLLDGLVKYGLAPDGKDPGMRGVTRYVRLPGGYNSKASRLIGGEPFDCRLLEFDEWSQRSTIEELAVPFGIDLDAERKEVTEGAANVNHPILSMIEVKSEQSPGAFDVTCPWVADHTGGDDSGTAVWTNADLSFGFKCHHGHCSDRTGKHLMGWIEESAPGWSKKLEGWKTYKGLGVEKGIDEIEDVTEPEDVQAFEPKSSIKQLPSLQEILDNLLSELVTLPKNKIAEEHAFKILKVADKVGGLDQSRAHDKIQKYLKWSSKDLKAVIKKQRTEWYKKTPDETTIHQQLNLHEFPHSDILDKGVRLYDSENNTKHLLNKYDITANWDQIKKKVVLHISGDDSSEYASLIETVIGLMRLNNIPQINTVNRVASIAHKNPINRVVECLSGLNHQGSGYIQRLAEHITVKSETEYIRDKVLRMWMIMACAAADHAESTPHKKAMPMFDSLMIFVGEQGIEKTKFFRAMLPKSLRRYFNNGVMIDPTDKDSVSECIQWWIVEAGEIDGIFKKIDITRFKAFFSKSFDLFRKPYERSEREYERRTAFVASTNEWEFLKDSTGNRRYWPLLVKKLVIPEDEELIDNAWAEAWQTYIDGEQWWPDAKFKKVLHKQTKLFQMSLSGEPIKEAIEAMIDLELGAFKCDVLRPVDIRGALNSGGLSGHNIEKVPTINMISRIMRQHELGTHVKTENGAFWIIRNAEKYENMRNADIEKYYNKGLISSTIRLQEFPTLNNEKR